MFQPIAQHLDDLRDQQNLALAVVLDDQGFVVASGRQSEGIVTGIKPLSADALSLATQGSGTSFFMLMEKDQFTEGEDFSLADGQQMLCLVSLVPIVDHAAATPHLPPASLVLVARMLSKPILKIAATTKKFINGDFDIAITVHGHDEIGQMAEARIRQLNDDLENRVQTRTQELTLANQAVNDWLTLLQKTQTGLIESEKMAALNTLVAGFAHEINIPLGVCVTAISYLVDNTICPMATWTAICKRWAISARSVPRPRKKPPSWSTFLNRWQSIPTMSNLSCSTCTAIVRNYYPACICATAGSRGFVGLGLSITYNLAHKSRGSARESPGVLNGNLAPRGRGQADGPIGVAQ